jgi:hypothetical protein
VSETASLVLSLFIARASYSVRTIADMIDPQTPEAAMAEGKYIVGLLRKEARVLGERSPVLSCNTLHMVREMRSWKYPSGAREDILLLTASKSAGRCGDEASLELEALLLDVPGCPPK